MFVICIKGCVCVEVINFLRLFVRSNNKNSINSVFFSFVIRAHQERNNISGVRKWLWKRSLCANIYERTLPVKNRRKFLCKKNTFARSYLWWKISKYLSYSFEKVSQKWKLLHYRKFSIHVCHNCFGKVWQSSATFLFLKRWDGRLPNTIILLYKCHISIKAWLVVIS